MKEIIFFIIILLCSILLTIYAVSKFYKLKIDSLINSTLKTFTGEKMSRTIVQQEDIFLKNNFGIEEEIFKNPTDININFKKGYGYRNKYFKNVYSLQTTPKTIIIRKRGNDEETKNFLKREIASCEIIQYKTSTIKITKKF